MSIPRIPLPEPLLSLVRTSRRAEARLFAVWGVILTLGGGGLTSYLVYYVLHRASFHGEVEVRTEELVALVVGVLLFGLGVLLAFGAVHAWRSQDDGGPLSDPDAKILDVRRVVNNAGRWLEVAIDVNGTEVRPRWRFTSFGVDEKAEVAACMAVEALPQWRGRGRPSDRVRRGEALVAQAIATASAAPGPAATTKRTAADAPFAQIHHAMTTAGLRLVSQVEEGVTLDPKPRDPIRAEYETRGARAVYLRSPETGLQTVEVTGEHAVGVFNDVLNVGYLPVLQVKLVPMLESGERRDVLRALGAIEFVHGGQPGTYYAPQLARLGAHEDPAIRDAARRAGVKA